MRRILATCALLLLTRSAAAGVEDTLGLGPAPMALGGSYAARPGDSAAAYYNPAGLAPWGHKKEHGGFFELTLGAVYAHPTLHVTGARGQELTTPEVPDTAGVLLGTRFSVGQPFHVDGLDMGISLFVPKGLFQWSIRPDDDVQWALLTDRTQVLSAHVGLAYRVAPWLSLGLGLRLSFGVQTLTRGQVTSVGLATDPQTGTTVVRTSTVLGTDAEVFGRVTPLVGVLLTPIDAVRIGLVYRHKSYVDDWGSTRISGVPDLGDMGYTHHFAHYFEPSEATAAVSADVGGGVDLSFDLTYARWSEALSTNLNFFGDGHWGDTWTPAFGARWRAHPGFALMAGYRFQKSPIDNVSGPNNLLDNDRHVLSLGFEMDFGKLFHTPSLDARLTVGMAAISLVSRTETKDYRYFASDDAMTRNPGYPSYEYGGHVLTMSTAVDAKW